jgi:hypothetical protein
MSWGWSMGRPSDYTPEIALTICERLVGTESLRKICSDEDMPSTTTVFRWLEAHESFREQYARAREMQADAFADEMTDIADTPMVGVIKKITEDGVEITEEDMLGHRKLRIDTRKWIASKLKPKRYGDKIDHTHGGDATRPIVITSTDAEL